MTRSADDTWQCTSGSHFRTRAYKTAAGLQKHAKSCDFIERDVTATSDTDDTPQTTAALPAADHPPVDAAHTSATITQVSVTTVVSKGLPTLIMHADLQSITDVPQTTVAAVSVGTAEANILPTPPETPNAAAGTYESADVPNVLLTSTSFRIIHCARSLKQRNTRSSHRGRRRSATLSCRASG